MKKTLVCTALLLTLGCKPRDFNKAQAFQATSSSPRPPQHVLLAFDNAQIGEFWEESRQFALEQERNLRPIKFTYFVSGIIVIPTAERNNYTAPKKVTGKSTIGWGGTNADVLEKYRQMNLAYEEGHELASHAVGHFNGSELGWTVNDWNFELGEFHKFMFRQQTPGRQLQMQLSEITGFRAPYLGKNNAMYDSLSHLNYKYDTSDTQDSNYWPEKKKAVWNFPLAYLKIVGTERNTLSMDYNFFANQASSRSDPKDPPRYSGETEEAYKQRLYATYGEPMYQTYIKYFTQNYYGNRAPVNIGHHFTPYMGGVYWMAMKKFAATVCGYPEVKCTTYRELTQFMDTTSPEQRKAYAAGKFPRLERPMSLAFGESMDESEFPRMNGRKLTQAEMEDLGFITCKE